MNGFVQDLFSLEGRVALVTGGSSGIGRRMAYALSRAGAAVVILGRDEARLKEAAEEARFAGTHSVETLAADLAMVKDMDILAGELSEFFGPPDILVNAAGVNFREPAEEVTRASWEATLTLNLTVPFFLAQALVPAMMKKGAGNIINIASLQSFRAFPNGLPYGASKGGVAQLTRAMAEAWSKDGIVANALAPGFFPTALTAPVFADAERSARNAELTAIGRNGELADLDGATVFLASKAAAYITGQVLPVDGGFTAK